MAKFQARIKDKLKNNKITAAVNAASISIMTAVLCSPVYCDALASSANKASNGIWETAKGILKPIVIIACLVIGFILIIGTRRRKEDVKENFPAIIGGIALIVLAPTLAGIMYKWF